MGQLHGSFDIVLLDAAEASGAKRGSENPILSAPSSAKSCLPYPVKELIAVDRFSFQSLEIHAKILSE